MRKNGFVFVETVIVICILSATLLILYASYSHILRVTRQKTTFDTTDNIYTTYYVKKIIDEFNGTGVQFDQFFRTYSTYCSEINNGSGYMCDISQVPDTDTTFYQLKSVFGVDKLYYLAPANILNDSNKTTYLMELDATTIDYVKALGVGATNNLFIVKYKHVYDNGTYEVFHASMEV